MSPFVDFAELKEKVPIQDVLPILGIAGAGNSAQWRGPCPACESGGDRALVVTPAKKAYYCFATRKGGDVIALVAHVKGISMKDAALAIAEYCGTVPVQDSGNSNSTRNSASSDTGNSTSPPERQETKKLEPLNYLNPSHSSLEALGLSEDTCNTFGAGYAPKGILRGRLAIPIHDAAGELVAYCGRAVEDEQSPWLTFPKGFQPEQYLFNLHRISEGELYCSADPLDVLLAYEHGVTNMISFLVQKTENVVAFPKQNHG